MARTRTLLREAAALGLAAAWAVFTTWPLARHAATRVPGDLGDPLENAWIFGWGAHALATQPRALFHANIFFPSRFSLAFAESMLGLSVPAAPVFWLTHNAVLTVNLAVIAMYAVTAYGTYRLLLRLTDGAAWPSALGAAAFTATPFRLFSLNHVHVVALFLLPFVLLVLLRLGAQERRLRWAALLAVLVAAQFWASLTCGLITLVAVGAWGLWTLAVDRRRALRPVLAAGAAMVAAGVLASPMLLAYRHARAQNPGYTHPEIEAVQFSATPGSYAAPPPGGPLARPVYDELADEFRPRVGGHEKALFPGVVLSAGALLALAALLLGIPQGGVLWKAWENGRRRAAVLALLLVAGGAAMSLGPRWGAKPGGAKLPFALLSEHVSGGLTRVPARFGTLVPFGLAVLVAVGVAALPKKQWRTRVAAAGLALVALEAWPASIRTVKPPPVNAAHRWLDSKQARPGAVLALPTIEYNPDGSLSIPSLVREAEQIYLSTGNFRPLVNGYAAFLPAPYLAITTAVQQFPSDQGMEAMRHWGVRYVVVENGLMAGSHWAGVGERLKAWPGVRLVKRAGPTEVYDVADAAFVPTTPAPSPPAQP